MIRKQKGPGELIDFGFDWADQMRKDMDSISTASWTVPAGITKGTEVLDVAKSISTVVLGGGTSGKTYICKNQVTTAGGRIWERHLAVGIVDNL